MDKFAAVIKELVKVVKHGFGYCSGIYLNAELNLRNG
jgi:hypothetical protein